MRFFERAGLAATEALASCLNISALSGSVMKKNYVGPRGTKENSASRTMDNIHLLDSINRKSVITVSLIRVAKRKTRKSKLIFMISGVVLQIGEEKSQTIYRWVICRNRVRHLVQRAIHVRDFRTPFGLSSRFHHKRK